MNLSKLAIYSPKEIYQLIKYSIGRKLLGQVPIGLRHSHTLFDELYAEGISLTKKSDSVTFNYSINNHPLTITLLKNSADMIAFKQVIMDKEYGGVVDFFKKNHLPLRTMIDAGANVGFTTIFMKSHFPDAKIICLEPSKATFERLQRNIRETGFKDITTLNLGLWGKKTHLSAAGDFEAGLDLAFRLVETSDASNALFEVTSIPSLKSQFELDEIDFLKIDIEGGEVSVFGKETELSWLNNVKVIAMEIHDEFFCRTEIENTLISYGFKLSHSGELTIGINLNLLP
ncbi:hypothetical protein Aoki45_16320 [Algoriphagus sp. oki45]|nr:hypothetical protein Aoki45_16320 [Algoriphagus sp. oki45]